MTRLFRYWNPRSFIAAALWLLVFACMAYLPRISELGTYGDDWHVAWAGKTQGAAQVFDMHKTDRPVMGLVYSFTFQVLGERPLAWQLYAVFLRFIGGLAFLWLMRQMYPGRAVITTLMAVLFTIYPGFLQMPTASSYQNHLLALASGIVSLGLSVQAIKQRQDHLRMLSAGLSAASALFCYMMMEWMIGLEAARYLLFAVLINRTDKSTSLKNKARKLLSYSWINLLVVVVYLTWRVFVFESARQPTDVNALFLTYASNPFFMSVRLLMETLKSLVDTLVLAWAVPFYQRISQAGYGTLAIALLLAGVGVLLFFILNKRMAFDADELSDEPAVFSWKKEAFWLGLAIAVVTLIPPVLANRSVSFIGTFDRYTLAASTGTVIALVAAISALSTIRLQRVFYACLISAALITHFTNAAYAAKAWEYQRQLWWQLSWRAPDIKNGTTLLALLPEGYRLAEHYELWAPANLIYHPQGDPAVMGEVVNQDTLPDILTGASYGRTFRRLPLVIDLKNSLVLSLPPGGSCLHLQDGANLELSSAEDPLVRVIAPRSNLDLVDHAAEPHRPPETIFGKEPDHGWCYYYQKAALARQQGDWKTVAALDAEAQALGLLPADPAEWMPFYEAYARLGDVPAVTELAQKLRAEPDFIGPYCKSLHIDSFDQNYRQYLYNLCP